MQDSARSGALASRVQFLDCVRALAIGLVVMVHYDRMAFQGGAIGVSIFFALSGYLITGMLLDEARLDWSATWRFLLRRLVRVYPPYLVAILLILGLNYMFNMERFNGVLGILPGLLTATWIYLQYRSGSESNLPVIAWLGRISYSLYLLHGIPLDYRFLLPAAWFGYGAVFGLLLLAFVAAVLMHYAIERPAIRLARWLTARPARAFPGVTRAEPADVVA